MALPDFTARSAKASSCSGLGGGTGKPLCMRKMNLANSRASGGMTAISGWANRKYNSSGSPLPRLKHRSIVVTRVQSTNVQRPNFSVARSLRLMFAAT